MCGLIGEAIYYLCIKVYYKLGIHDMQQASRKAEPGDYKHEVNDMYEWNCQKKSQM